MKSFFYNLIASFTDPHSYKKWLILPQKKIVGFFTINMFIVGMINGGIFAFKQLPELVNSYQNFQANIITQYPEDLTISWQNKLVFEPTEKYANFSLNLNTVAGLNELPDSTIYYQQTEPSSEKITEIVNQEQTIFLATPEKIFFKNEDNHAVSQNLTELFQSEYFSITKADLPYLETSINQQISNWQPKIQAILPPLIGLLNLISSFATSLVLATLLWLILKFFPLTIKRWNFSWRLTLAVFVTISYLEILVQLIYPNNLTNIKEIGFWLITGYVLLTWKFPRFKIQTN